jgi:hypothetical protein
VTRSKLKTLTKSSEVPTGDFVEARVQQ